MHAKILAVSFCFAAFTTRMSSQVVGGSEFTASANDTFTDPPNTMSHYALTWGDYSGGTIGPSAMLSGYGGINLYTTGTRRLTITYQGNVGIGTTSPISKLHLGVGSGDGITIGNPSDPLGNGGTYAIKFYGYRDITPNVINAKITAERTNVCCGWLAQGLDLAFYTTNGNGTANADNSIERMRIKDSGNVGIGTASPAYLLDVAGSIHASQAISASGGITFADGSSQTTAFNTTLCGGDYAESVDVSGDRAKFEAGDLLVIDPKAPGKFLKASRPYSTLVAGIYSTKPGTIGRRQKVPKSPDEVPMAMVGIVPTKVSTENGAIEAGDLLVSSATPGYAMKGTDRSLLTGAVVGKALGSLESGQGEIEVLVTLQ